MEEEYIKELLHKRGKRWVNIGESYKMYAGIIEYYKRGKLLLKKKNIYIYIYWCEKIWRKGHTSRKGHNERQWKLQKNEEKAIRENINDSPRSGKVFIQKLWKYEDIRLFYNK